MEHNIKEDIIKSIEIVVINKKCMGCGACSIICRHNAISIEMSRDGFWVPVVDKNKCIKCGSCKSVCPSINHGGKPLNEKNVYVGAVKDRRILSKSSSGGMGYFLSKKSLEKGISVCGVKYDFDSNIAYHAVTKMEAGIVEFQGSKYLQSNCADGFAEILKCNEGIVFGTPCQIAGICKCLDRIKKRENFILVDFFCHGVPSYLAWFSHISNLKCEKNEKEIQFRFGKKFELNYCSYKKSALWDDWYNVFLRSYLNNRSCYSCPYRRTAWSDIRIGDFPAEKFKKISYYPSVIVVNSEKGANYWKECCLDKTAISAYRESYELIDSIQENVGKKIPNDYEKALSDLRKGKKLSAIYKRKKIINTVKAIVRTIIDKKRQKKEDEQLGLSNLYEGI